MKTHFIALAILLVALLGCRKNEQADGKSQAANVLTSITFQVDDPERKAEGPSSYINLAEPEKDLKHLRNAEEVVFTGTNLIVVLDYPLHNESTFPINASAPSGFTRAEIVRKIADLYKKVYEEEARTSKIPVTPPEQRKSYNRNETNGKYGIWGHDLGDLELHTIELSREADGTVSAHLGIDS